MSDVSGNERRFLLVGKGLSDEEMADTVMEWLDEQGLAEDDGEPPTGPTPIPSGPNPSGLVAGHERASDVLAKMAGAQETP